MSMAAPRSLLLRSPITLLLAALSSACSAQEAAPPGTCKVEVRKAARDDKPASAAIVARLLQARLDLLAHPQVEPCRFTLAASSNPSGGVTFLLEPVHARQRRVQITARSPFPLNTAAALAMNLDKVGVLDELKPSEGRLCSSLPADVGHLEELKRHPRLIYIYDDEVKAPCDLGCEALAKAPFYKTLYIHSEPENWELYREIMGQIGAAERDRMESIGVWGGIPQPGWYEIRVHDPDGDPFSEATSQPSGIPTLRLVRDYLVARGFRVERWVTTLMAPDGVVLFRRSGALASEGGRLSIRCGYETQISVPGAPIFDLSASSTKTKQKD